MQITTISRSGNGRSPGNRIKENETQRPGRRAGTTPRRSIPNKKRRDVEDSPRVLDYNAVEECSRLYVKDCSKGSSTPGRPVATGPARERHHSSQYTDSIVLIDHCALVQDTMKGRLLCVLLLCAVAGTLGCGRSSTTTTIPPAIEPEIIAVTAAGPSEAGRGPGGSRVSLLTTTELQNLSEELLRVDTGLQQLSINLQGKTSSAATRDSASNPLFNSVPAATMNTETVRLMQNLLDNYLPQTTSREVYTDAEKNEENQFLDALMKTQVMRNLESYLKRKRIITGSLRTTLKDIWFTQYKRGGRQIGSSGFEHVFVGELKGGKVSGLHNWQNFKKEEEEGDLDYKGYIRILDLNGKGKIIKLRFVWLNEPKPVGSIFVGVTPELELALYTVCFLAKPDSRCPVKLSNKKFNIQTWTYTVRGQKVIGSAYPDI
ncbi:poly(U)-specific endoribonuclease homolog isoform X1 [Penaeus japonicus]|uniref:poly(U)-specific endoribonuclease homolog isoform X1 n=1 Tax=Penaeus japonicus TaxID=27405 RepID=UPI001C70E3CD|nr:poly(U)-specific endoribonuclease homolog isoform X1 [Penaeus japonicus]